jgi:hypothetical protein
VCISILRLIDLDSKFVNPELLNEKGGMESVQLLLSGKFDILKKEAEEALSFAQIQSMILLLFTKMILRMPSCFMISLNYNGNIIEI